MIMIRKVNEFSLLWKCFDGGHPGPGAYCRIGDLRRYSPNSCLLDHYAESGQQSPDAGFGNRQALHPIVHGADPVIEGTFHIRVHQIGIGEYGKGQVAIPECGVGQIGSGKIGLTHQAIHEYASFQFRLCKISERKVAIQELDIA
jgi:hypothetical protein